jgi:hypothetical protein
MAAHVPAAPKPTTTTSADSVKCVDAAVMAQTPFVFDFPHVTVVVAHSCLAGSCRLIEPSIGTYRGAELLIVVSDVDYQSGDVVGPARL